MHLFIPLDAGEPNGVDFKSSPTTQSPPNAASADVAVVVTTASSSGPTTTTQFGGSSASGGGGGIGLFAKKRTDALLLSGGPPPAAAISTTTTIASPKNSNNDCQSLLQQHLPGGATNANTASGSTTTLNSVKEASSVADLSRFDTDLVSKNAKGGGTMLARNLPPTTTNTTDVSSSVVPGSDLGRVEGAVPKTIPMMSGGGDDDDIDDDLTIGTTVAEIGGGSGDIVFTRREENGTVLLPDGNAELGPSVPQKMMMMSPYFSNTLNKTDGQGHATDTTTTTMSKIAENPSERGGVGGGDVNHPSSSSSSLALPRVSFSPPPPPPSGGLNVNVPRPLVGPNFRSNQPALFSPRKGYNTMDASPDDDDNSIVIPGVPASVANNMNMDGKGTVTSDVVMAAAGVGLRSVNQLDSTNRNNSSQSSVRASAEGRIGSALPNNGQKPWSASANNEIPQQSALDHSSTTIHSRGIGQFVDRAEKVKFTNAASSDRNGSAASKKSKVATVGVPFINNSANSMMVNTSTVLASTAITPDHRQVVAGQYSESTPYTQCMNDNHGDGGAVTPTPHKVSAQTVPTQKVPLPVATTPTTTTDFQRMATMEDEPQIEKQLALSEIPPRGRPRSQTIYSPPPSTATTGESVTPKACNNNLMNPTTATSNEGFDDLLSEFVTYIQEGSDIYERGQSDLLELEVDLSHAFAAVLRYKDEYTTLLSEIECVQARAENIVGSFQMS